MYPKRCSMTLAVAVLMAGLVAPTKVAFALSGNASKAVPPSQMNHDGDSPGETADPGEAGKPDGSGSQGESGSDRDSPCTSVSSAAPAAGPVTVCTGQQAG